MFEKFFYQEKGLFLQSLHPVTAMTYVGVLFVLSLLFNHPLYLLGILGVIFLSIRAVDGLGYWESYLKFAVGMTLFIIIVNALTVNCGESVIWDGPRLPVIGAVTVSLEALCCGAAMGVRLLNVVSVFCLYNLMVHPDKVLNLISRFAAGSALVLSLSSRMVPMMARHLGIIREALVCRGVDFKKGTWKERLEKSTLPVTVLLSSSLESSLEIAEALHARAYGSGRRSCYRRDLTRPRDVLCAGSAILALAVAVWCRVRGCGSFDFYPRLGFLVADSATLTGLLAIILLLSVPVLLSWGWRYCPCLRLKI
ncbi:MAG: energy-coupling factor transporter transmembrane component T [Bacillota bacterium]